MNTNDKAIKPLIEAEYKSHNLRLALRGDAVSIDVYEGDTLLSINRGVTEAMRSVDRRVERMQTPDIVGLATVFPQDSAKTSRQNKVNH